MRVTPSNRPLRLAVLPALLGATSALGLGSALSATALVAGLLAGLAAGFIAGWWLTVASAGRLLGSRPLATVVGTVSAAVVMSSSPVWATGDPSAIGRVRRVLGAFLTVALPARGLDDLAAVVVVVVTPTVAVTVWAGWRARPLVAVTAALTGLAVATLLAGSRPPPWWVPAVVVALGGVLFLVESRTYYTELPPLVGTSTAVRRQLPWWRPGLVGLIAVAAAGGAAFVPSRDAFDVRRFVEPDVITAADANPLATVARLRVDPPAAAEGVDVVVDVDGPSPGRLRLAVLDEYRAEGWRQSARFAVTGVVLPPPAVPVEPSGFEVAVRVVDGPADSGLRAAPTGGEPTMLDVPAGARFSVEAGVLLPGDSDELAYTTRPAPDEAPPGALGPPVGLPARWYECPAGTTVESSARTLAEGTTTSAQRLERIEAWLKLTKLYDPEGPGGQTIGSVEQFVAQPYARGNLEAFVTAFALLSRCAGVPVRVVVGYPAPTADRATEYRVDEMTAWVETPIDGVGWVAVDPVPTPAEQQRQAELADETPPPPPTEPPPTAPPPIVVVPTAPDRGEGIGPLLVVGSLALAAGLLAALWTWWVGRAIIRRRRRVADPATATTLAWRSLLEAARDRGVELGPHLTARETARAGVGRLPASVSRVMDELARLADRAAFDAPYTTDADAAVAWALATVGLERLPASWAVRLLPLRHPGRVWRRWRSAARLTHRSSPWQGEVPPSVLADRAADTPVIPGCRLEARLGDGATAVVYRGHDEQGRSVAIKVFHADLAASELDRQRFEWEARVAAMVSGREHLPVVYDAGVADGGRAYLVTKIYERGTLLRRIQRSGPLAPGEVSAAGRQLATALGALHQHGLLHGDVKPENVFIDDDGSLVLGDLGSAWLWADGGPASAPTPPYAAPEVWLGHAPTVASDLYSLGLTLMFAASGRRPVAGSPPTGDEVREVFGNGIAVVLLDIDPRRRPRRAADVAVLFGADPGEVASSVQARAVPTPTFTGPPPP